jgi:hypothetical protein
MCSGRCPLKCNDRNGVNRHQLIYRAAGLAAASILLQGCNVLTFPGFYQIFFYGDHKRQMKNFCRLRKFDAQIV